MDARATFDEFDANNNGVLDREEARGLVEVKRASTALPSRLSPAWLAQGSPVSTTLSAKA